MNQTSTVLTKLINSLPDQMLETLNAFLSDRELQGFRGTSEKKQAIKKLLFYLHDNGLNFQDVGIQEAQEYQAWLLSLKSINDKSYQAGTISNFLKGANVFYDYLKKEGRVYSNPFAELRRIRVSKKVPRNILSEKEMIQLLTEMRNYRQHHSSRNQKAQYKMHVLCELLYSTGLRIGEAANIRKEDIDFHRGNIKVTDIKNGHEKNVFLNDYARHILQIYVEEMKDLVLEKPGRPDYLFGVEAKTLVISIGKSLKEVSEKLGLPVTTSHGFRHAVGYHFLRAGCDIRFIQEILGHEHITSTEIYTKVDKKDLKKVLDKYHPRNWKKKHEETEL